MYKAAHALGEFGMGMGSLMEEEDEGEEGRAKHSRILPHSKILRARTRWSASLVSTGQRA